MSRPDYQLCTPWYARSSPGEHRPDVRTHLVPDWPKALIAAPATTGSPPADTWGYFVPPLKFKVPIIERHRTVQTALYPPTATRFHSLAIELCLAGPAADPAGDVRDVTVTFVVRRYRFVADLTAPNRLLARAIAKSWDPGQNATTLVDDDLLDVLGARDFLPTGQQVNAVQTCQALTGTGWQTIGCAAPFALIDGEHEYPMWRRVAADPHVLWFGAVPVDAPYQVGLDPLDARDPWTYRLACVARRPAAPDKEFCPPSQWLSATSMPFRIAPLLMTL